MMPEEPQAPAASDAATDQSAARAATRALVAEGALLFVAAVIALIVSSHLRSTTYDQAVRQAYAWLHGRFWIDWPGPYLEALDWKGHRWAQYPPFPALLTVPLVAFKGLDANQTTVSLIVCVVALALAWLLLVRLDVARASRIWLMLFLFAGTDLWWCAELGDVWFIAHVAAVACTFGALYELATRRRGWLVALLAFCAFESRAVTLLAVPLYLFLLVRDDFVQQVPDWTPAADTTSVRGRLTGFGLTACACLCAYAGYNFAKWGVPYDIGYALYAVKDSASGKLFDISYVPYEVYSFFMRPPVVVEWRGQALWPLFNIDNNGVALTFTSPALLLAFHARIPLRLRVALWTTVVLVLIPNLLYYLNGWYQFGMRHALDFEPFLFVLMAFAVRKKMPLWGALLISYSALVGLWGVWWWGAYMRTYD